MPSSERYIGLMSGTSLDGVDAVLVEFGSSPKIVRRRYLPFEKSLKERILALQDAGLNELDRAFILANDLAGFYAEAANSLLDRKIEVSAIGAHGQTVRHCPQSRYTIQLCNSALLAELTGITVVSDFRSRDIAAGGQGAPLVPAFHADVFRDSRIHRVIVNIGGISNLSNLPPGSPATGFDCGPGNMLMDSWASLNIGKAYDEDGSWSATGKIIPQLLQSFLEEDFFQKLPPKSTGRDLFNLSWLKSKLGGDESAADVQATLLALTTQSIAQSIKQHCPGAAEIYICGGGAKNAQLLRSLRNALPGINVFLTDAIGIEADWVEAVAFAWLARKALRREPANLPEVTGARGRRVLGAIYPA